jgi:hypothetical protein
MKFSEVFSFGQSYSRSRALRYISSAVVDWKGGLPVSIAKLVMLGQTCIVLDESLHNNPQAPYINSMVMPLLILL